MQILDPLPLGPLLAPNRVMFGPIVTNLGDDDRLLTARHAQFYQRRAIGGCGIIVVEGASVHESDWPYERAPLAQRCGPGWAQIATACHQHGALVLASLDHAGGQGSSAYNQLPMLAPSRVPEVNSREVPKWMEPEDIDAVIQGFADAAALAVRSGCDGVEVNAGQHSLVRQFLSGLTNHRGDQWGQDRTLFARQILDAVRSVVGSDHVVGLRLSCDELAPWAGITPQAATELAPQLAACGIDYLVVCRGSIYSHEKTRADFHEPDNFNLDLCASIKGAVGDLPVFLQGSVIDPNAAERALADGICNGVEMTRAQLADPDVVSKLREGQVKAIRPCIRCNQTCQVRDARNPIISCVAEPSTGRESDDPNWFAATTTPLHLAVVGGGVAGLEAARVAALRGHRVTLIEQSDQLGGLAIRTGPGRPFAQWLVEAVHAAGVTVMLNTSQIPVADVVVQATGGQPGTREYHVDADATVIDIVQYRLGLSPLPDGPIAIFDPIGGPIAIALAEELGERATLITQDNIAGNELSRTGDLAPANVRLAQKGVTICRRALLRAVHADAVQIEDRFSGQQYSVAAAALVDCGFRLPTDQIAQADMQIGDCVAPRTMYEAVLEGRRAALAADSVLS